MKKTILLITTIVCLSGLTTTLQAQKTVMVGGEQMYPTKNIVENAVNSKAHTTLVAAVKPKLRIKKYVIA